MNTDSSSQFKPRVIQAISKYAGRSPPLHASFQASDKPAPDAQLNHAWREGLLISSVSDQRKMTGQALESVLFSCIILLMNKRLISQPGKTAVRTDNIPAAAALLFQPARQ